MAKLAWQIKSIPRRIAPETAIVIVGLAVCVFLWVLIRAIWSATRGDPNA